YCVFFSSRRRHTRSTRDWSSDVCSSDLDCRPIALHSLQAHVEVVAGKTLRAINIGSKQIPGISPAAGNQDRQPAIAKQIGHIDRSEERRVGKESRSRGKEGYRKKRSKRL